MAITSLTGTTWVINENPSITSAWAAQVSFTSSESELLYSFFATNMSYYSGALIYNSETAATVFAYRNDTSSWTNEAYRTVTFTSEVTDESGYLTQTEFITWLEANAVQVIPEPEYIDKTVLLSGDEYYFKDTISGYISSSDLVAGTNISIEENSEGKAVISSSSNARVRIIRLPKPTISDLTGTTWLINAAPSLPSTSVTYTINFSTTWESYGEDLDCTSIFLYTTIVYNIGYNQAVYDGTSWNDASLRTIRITGGTDATNSNFIAWLLANATQVS